METKVNAIGIDHNLNRSRIKKLLTIGLAASVITGVGDFLLGSAAESPGANLAESVMSGALNLTDWQMIVGGMLGMFGIFLEGLAYFAIYRLMADAAPRYAHLYRAGIFGYIWLAPIGCHLNMGILNLAYKYLLIADSGIAAQAAGPLFYGFSLPVYLLLVLFWLPMIVLQFQAFAKGLTPYPKSAKGFNLIVGAIPALIVSVLIGDQNPWGPAIGTMFLSFGNAFTFGGLLATLPGQERFEQFQASIEKGGVNA